MEPEKSGTLYVVATPIGNLDDMTFRAVKTLKSVDMIAAEDTRHSKKLLTHFQIPTKLISCHEHNEIQKTPQLIERLQSGQDIAIISDAGTPCISDPGFTLIKTARQNNIPVIPIPGASASVAGLSVSGLPSDRFYFLGFLSKKQQQQKKQIQDVSNINATLIIYESPKRILKLLDTLISVLGDRDGFLTREMTKRHETYIFGKLSLIHATLNEQATIKGEIALYIKAALSDAALPDKNQLEAILKEKMRDPETGTSDLARQVAKDTGLSKKQVYDTIIRLKQT